MKADDEQTVDSKDTVVTGGDSGLGSAPVPGLLFRFAVPSIVALLVHAAYNIIDRIFIGQMVGPEGLAAASVCFPAMMVQFAFTLLIAVGESAIASICLGRGDRNGASSVFANAVWMSLAMSIVVPLAGLAFLDPILKVSGASEATLPAAREYMQVILLGTGCLTGSFILHYHIRAVGHPRAAMALIIVGSGMNAILDPIFIGPLGMGVKGAAVATVLAEFLSFAVAVIWLSKHRETPSIRRGLMKPDLKQWGRIAFLGQAPFFSQIVGSVQFSILNYQVARYGGDIAVGATGIMFALSSFVILPVFGIADGMQPIVGYNFGARNPARVRQTVRLALIAATVSAVLGFLVVESVPRFLTRLFTGDDSFMDLTAHAIRIVFSTAPLFGIQAIGVRYFQSVGRGGMAAFLSLSRQILFYIPLLIILPPIWKLDGVWMVPPVADVFSTAVTAVLLWMEIHRLKKASLS